MCQSYKKVKNIEVVSLPPPPHAKKRNTLTFSGDAQTPIHLQISFMQPIFSIFSHIFKASVPDFFMLNLLPFPVVALQAKTNVESKHIDVLTLAQCSTD